MLSSVPEIYKSFNVVVLLPGSSCDCWSLKARLDSGDAGALKAEESDQRPRKNSSVCFNDVGVYGWVTRLWTRQEMLYAGNVRIVWASQCVSECPQIDMRALEDAKMSSKDQPGLSRPARSWYEKCEEHVS